VRERENTFGTKPPSPEPEDLRADVFGQSSTPAPGALIGVRRHVFSPFSFNELD